MLIKALKTALLVVFLFSALNPVSAQKPAPKAVFKVDYEKFTLANGLQVIFHIDRSDPVVAVALLRTSVRRGRKRDAPALPICLNTSFS